MIILFKSESSERPGEKPYFSKKEHGWTKLERIKMDYIWVNLKNVGPPLFKFISIYIKI